MAEGGIKQPGTAESSDAFQDAISAEALRLWGVLPERCAGCPVAQQLVLNAARMIVGDRRHITELHKRVTEYVFTVLAPRRKAPPGAQEYIETQSNSIAAAQAHIDSVEAGVAESLSRCLDGPRLVRVRAASHRVVEVVRCEHPEVVAARIGEDG